MIIIVEAMILMLIMLQTFLILSTEAMFKESLPQEIIKQSHAQKVMRLITDKLLVITEKQVQDLTGITQLMAAIMMLMADMATAAKSVALKLKRQHMTNIERKKVLTINTIVSV